MALQRKSHRRVFVRSLERQVPGKPVANNSGPRSNYVLLWGLVACDSRLLGFPGGNQHKHARLH